MATAGIVAMLCGPRVSSMAQPPGGGPGAPEAAGRPPAMVASQPSLEDRRTYPADRCNIWPDGHPDMQGFWNAANNGGAVFELQNHPTGRAAVLWSRQRRYRGSRRWIHSLYAWAAAKAKDLFENHLADEPELHCYESGVPKQMYVQFGFQIFQPANYVVLTWEFMHAYRIIPTDGRPHIPANIKLFQGDSVGHWEGDTLVVDTTNLNDRTWYDTVGNFHSDAEHVVERFTPVDTTTIKYEATVEDPKVLTKPFKMEMELDKNDRSQVRADGVRLHRRQPGREALHQGQRRRRRREGEVGHMAAPAEPTRKPNGLGRIRSTR